jgi:hypothetical protein
MSTQAERGGRSDAHAKKHPEKLDPQLALPIRLLRTWLCNRSAGFGHREDGSRLRQDFALGRKPMLIVLALDAAARCPDLVSSLANAVFQTSEIVPSAMPGLHINGMHTSPHLQKRMS